MKVFISDAVEKLHRKSSVYFKSYIYNGVFWELVFIIHIGESSYYDVNMCKKKEYQKQGRSWKLRIDEVKHKPIQGSLLISNLLKTSATAINLRHTFLWVASL